jgi:hypothetical protein
LALSILALQRLEWIPACEGVYLAKSGNQKAAFMRVYGEACASRTALRERILDPLHPSPFAKNASFYELTFYLLTIVSMLRDKPIVSKFGYYPNQISRNTPSAIGWQKIEKIRFLYHQVTWRRRG